MAEKILPQINIDTHTHILGSKKREDRKRKNKLKPNNGTAHSFVHSLEHNHLKMCVIVCVVKPHINAYLFMLFVQAKRSILYGIHTGPFGKLMSKAEQYTEQRIVCAFFSTFVPLPLAPTLAHFFLRFSLNVSPTCCDGLCAMLWIG